MNLTHIIFLSLIVFVSSCHKMSSSGVPVSWTNLKEFTVDKGAVVREVLADGLLYSPSTKSLSVSAIQWYWDFTIIWTKEEGSLVKSGDVILQLDNATAKKDLDTQEIELEQEKLKFKESKLKTEDQIADALADVTMKEFELKKAKLSVVESDVVSLNERKKQKLDVASAEAALKRAQEKVKAIREQSVKSLEVQELKVKRVEEESANLKKGLSLMDIKAPQDGLLIFPTFSTSSGAQKAKPGVGTQVGTLVAEIADPSQLVARLYIPEVDMAGIVTGIPCTLSLDINVNEIIEGKVTKVGTVPSTRAERDGSKSSSASNNVRQFEVWVELSKLPEKSLPGLTVKARLQAAKRENVVRVPLEILKLNQKQADATLPEASKNKVTLLVKPKSGGIVGGDWKEKEITIGAISSLYAEVIEGLDEGDHVKSL